MTTFATLKGDIEELYPHSDYTDTLKATFVRMCEAEIRRRLRIQPMEVTDTSFTQSAQSTALPSGWIQFRSVSLNETNKRDLDYLPPNRFRSSGVLDDSGSAYAYTVEGQNLVISPWSSSVTLTLVYLKMFDALAQEADTNWALTNAYDLYLYGSLKHTAIWAQDQQAATAYNLIFDEVLERLNRENRWSRVSGDKLFRTGGSTP